MKNINYTVPKCTLRIFSYNYHAPRLLAHQLLRLGVHKMRYIMAKLGTFVEPFEDEGVNTVQYTSKFTVTVLRYRSRGPGETAIGNPCPSC